MATIRLTDRRAKTIKAGSGTIAHGGVGGLSLAPSKKEDGKGSWIVEYRDAVTGRRCRDTLGHYPQMSIAEAGRVAAERKEQAAQGKSPRMLDAQSMAAEKQAAENTLEMMCRAYFQKCLARGVWRNQAEIKKRMRRLEIYVFPLLGNRPIRDVSAFEIVNCLQTPVREKKIGVRVRVSLKDSKGVWIDSPEVGNKILEFLNQVFQHAEALGMRDNNPIPAVRRGLGEVKDTRQKSERRYPSMPYSRLPAFVEAVLGDERLTDGKQILLIQILTAARTGAVRMMKWEDVDLVEGVWKLPARSELAKTESDRFFPLTPEVARLLTQRKMEAERIGEAAGLVFKNKRDGGAYSEMVVTAIMKAVAASGGIDLLKSDIVGKLAVPHGFRASFRTWATDRGFDDRWAETQLCHVFGNEVQQAYDRGSLVEQRRAMMAGWEAFVMSEIREAGDE